jgi:hypothetical protein
MLINQQNNNGDLPMHIAVRNQNEKIAKLLDNAGCKKTIPNNKGLIVSSSESPPPSASEYSRRLFSMFGGQQSPTNSTKSSNSSFENKKSALADINTDVSIEYSKSKPVNNLKKSLMDFTSDISIDNKSITGRSLSTDNLSKTSLSTSLSTSPSTSPSTSSSESKSSSTTGGSSEISSESFSSSVTESSSMTYSGSSSNSGGQTGGAKSAESSELSDTSTFVKSLLAQFNSMKGGSRNVRGQRILPSLSDYELSEMYGGRDFGLSREQMKESSNIHDEVVKMFVDSGKTEEEARILKMALYKYTKDKNPELNNLDRAKKMKEYAGDSKIIKSLDLTATRKIYEDVKKSKSMMTDSSSVTTNTETSETTEVKPKKTSVKKTTAKKK